MRCLDVIWMIISPCSTDTFRFFVVWDDVVVISEFLVTDSTYPVLFDNLPV